MPVIHVHITRKESADRKARVVREITDTMVRVLGKPPEHTHVLISELGEGNWGFGGRLTSEMDLAGAPTPVTAPSSRARQPGD